MQAFSRGGAGRQESPWPSHPVVTVPCLLFSMAFSPCQWFPRFREAADPLAGLPVLWQIQKVGFFSGGLGSPAGGFAASLEPRPPPTHPPVEAGSVWGKYWKRSFTPSSRGDLPERTAASPEVFENTCHAPSAPPARGASLGGRQATWGGVLFPLLSHEQGVLPRTETLDPARADAGCSPSCGLA